MLKTKFFMLTFTSSPCLKLLVNMAEVITSFAAPKSETWFYLQICASCWLSSCTEALDTLGVEPLQSVWALEGLSHLPTSWCKNLPSADSAVSLVMNSTRMEVG